MSMTGDDCSGPKLYMFNTADDIWYCFGDEVEDSHDDDCDDGDDDEKSSSVPRGLSILERLEAGASEGAASSLLRLLLLAMLDQKRQGKPYKKH